MNLDKVADDEKLRICRRYFVLGFYLLPAVWLANSVWFFKEAFLKRGSNPLLRRYVAGSILGSLVWAAALIVWISVFQTQRQFWGAYGDYFSLTLPLGKP
eukprot:Em0004g959a